MAITVTTLAGAVAVGDLWVNLTATTGVSAPVGPTGSGYTYIKVDAEVMFVNGAVVGSAAPVLRGQLGTVQAAHLTSAPVLIGGPSDFPNFKASVAAFQALGEDSVGSPLTGATIAPTGGAIHHFTGSTAITSITPIDASKAQKITLIMDGSAAGLGWTGAATANAPRGTGVCTQYQAVDFFYDPSTTYWYPSTIT